MKRQLKPPVCPHPPQAQPGAAAHYSFGGTGACDDRSEGAICTSGTEDTNGASEPGRLVRRDRPGADVREDSR